MSGPLTATDATVDPDVAVAEPPEVEVTESHEAVVGRFHVRRALPRRGRRTVGAWCSADHMGPAEMAGDEELIGPHPHMGLQTVTWLLSGELLHRDSLGSEQPIKPGQLNLMTAGGGVAHAEESTGSAGRLHGIQLWIAQPDTTRSTDAAFEHHAELPQVELDGADATVLVGSLGSTASDARHDTPLVGVELDVGAGVTTAVPARRDFEHALVVLEGAVTIGDTTLTPGHLGYLGSERDEIPVRATERSRALLIGGVPFTEPIVMWWNFVGRSRDEFLAAHDDWNSDTGRFGRVPSTLQRIPAPAPYWTR
jgi:quercetin 2,3-dioxygenase